MQHEPRQSLSFYDRRATLALLADGGEPESVYGPDRPHAAAQLRAIVTSVALDEHETLLAALAPTRQLLRRQVAYRRGMAFLHDAYYSYYEHGTDPKRAHLGE